MLKNPEKIRQNWSDVYGGANNAHKVAVLEEGMSYKAISLPPEDSQFLSTRQFGGEEICRIFRVPPHMVQDLQRATFNNIEHMSIEFVMHTLMPWLIRIEQAIIKDVLIDEEKDEFFPKFNVDGLMRGDYKSRMEGYAVAITNGIMSVNDVRKLENLDPLDEAEGGDLHLINGSYTRLSEAGKAYGANVVATTEKETAQHEEAGEQETDSEGGVGGDESDSREQSREAPGHARRRAERRALRQNTQPRRAGNGGKHE